MRRAIRLHARGPALAWRPSPLSRALRPLSTSTPPPSDAYQVLGVSSSASADELRDAYRRLAKEWHPDVHQGPSSAAAGARFQEIAQAYQTLSDSARRAEYDAEIAAAKSDEARAAAAQRFRAASWDVEVPDVRERMRKGARDNAAGSSFGGGAVAIGLLLVSGNFVLIFKWLAG